ncbi:MAG: glycosyl transferase [Chthoniobacterales bacterium]|nr:MAG: glycosyl transferase [Chthoniobacterales bacterium]
MLPAFSVVVPAFNEAERIGDTLRTTLEYLRANSPQSELIVVNDGSSDGTGGVVRAVFAKEQVLPTRLLDHRTNRGKGAAVREGLLSATNAIAVFFDADLSTPIEELPKILEPSVRDEVDVAFGSRALDRTLIGHRQPWRREQAGRVFNLLVRVATGLPFWDTQCGFKAFRMQACRPIIAAAQVDGFGFDVELLFLAQRAGLRLREIPVRWNHSEGSKVHFVHDSLRMLREVMTLRSDQNGNRQEVRRPA